jgi:hypothetical protein
MSEHCTFDRYLYVEKYTILSQLSLRISCELSFPIVRFKMFSTPTLALKSPNNIFRMVCRELSMSLFLVEVIFHNTNFILCWSMNVQNNDVTPATSYY